MNTYNVNVTLGKNLVISQKQFNTITTRRKFWWLRKTANGFDDGSFIDIGEIKGTTPFSMNLTLCPGDYSIGCGTKKTGVYKNLI
jgi:hypothetical protein